ncbi:hypothetical protein ABZ636_28725 [Streptomyces sp. NPDC007251]|uniref:hypothetical protein n=1 Tax=Streptomyces sp. NPDC007251 TaxID=3154483 RepID=UPI0033D860AB
MNPIRKLAQRRRRVLVATALALPLLVTGCSKDVNNNDVAGVESDPKPTTLAVDKARAQTNHLSSLILDMIGIKEGKVTEGGAGVSLCDNDPDHFYRMRHPWSIYQVSEGKLKQGFQRLRKNLPERGWKIVDYGPNSSKAKVLELTADSKNEPYSVNAVLVVSTPTHSHESNPRIEVTVVSACFRAPKGTDLGKEF